MAAQLLDPPSAAPPPASAPSVRPATRPAPAARMTAEEYLAWEADPARARERKSEFFEGEVREMPGVTPEHDEITSNINRLVHAVLDPDRYAVIGSELKLGVGDRAFLYSDGAIAERPLALRPGGDRVVVNPLVVFEVLSPSTEAADWGHKLDSYTDFESLRHYVLVSQDRPCVDSYSREDRRWFFARTAAGQTVALPGVGIELPVDELYRNVAFGPPAGAAEAGEGS